MVVAGQSKCLPLACDDIPLIENEVPIYITSAFFSLCPFCREVWPDDVFGRDGMPVDEELDVIKEILLNPQSGQLHTASDKSLGRPA